MTFCDELKPLPSWGVITSPTKLQMQPVHSRNVNAHTCLGGECEASLPIGSVEPDRETDEVGGRTETRQDAKNCSPYRPSDSSNTRITKLMVFLLLSFNGSGESDCGSALAGRRAPAAARSGTSQAHIRPTACSQRRMEIPAAFFSFAPQWRLENCSYCETMQNLSKIYWRNDKPLPSTQPGSIFGSRLRTRNSQMKSRRQLAALRPSDLLLT